MGTLGTDVGMAVVIFPPKLGPVGAKVGSGNPGVRPTPRAASHTPFILDTARWAPILCTSVSGHCTSVFSVKWAHLVCVMQDEVFCVFLLCLVLVFSLFRV